ncbi:MAG: nucleotidyltransferase [Phycisphaerae bacterium]|jgi:hypothetical protein
MNNQQKNQLLESMVGILELPDSAYEQAKLRYEDISKWLCRAESRCRDNRPYIFPQGSFRLGTAIPPIKENEEYDLDLVCRLESGIVKSSYTQYDLKMLIGNEIEAYRVAKVIEAPKEEKHRCWRLNYADKLSFHMDILPCIPADESKRKLLFEAMKTAGEDELIAGSMSKFAISITDDRHPKYRQISDEWPISNPEGYAQWFVSRMKLAKRLLAERVEIFKAANIDELPVYRWKTPLQRCVQMLKRHRDRMFEHDQDVKPVSVIITTLSARAYQGETDIDSAMRTILNRMSSFVNKTFPRVPNPVDPREDFADRWSREKHLNLEQNFWKWLEQAQVDSNLIGSSDDVSFAAEQAMRKFNVRLDESDLKKRLGLSVASVSVTPKTQTITGKSPWCKEE